VSIQPFGLAYAVLVLLMAVMLGLFFGAGRGTPAAARFRTAAILGGVALLLGPIAKVVLSTVEDSGRLMDVTVLGSLASAAAGMWQATTAVRSLKLKG
jgi:hypothetical protein